MMRDFSEYEKYIIKRIVSECNKNGYSISMNIIVQEMEKVDIVAIEWDEGYSYAKFYGINDHKSYTKVFDIIFLLKYLDENRFISIHSMDENEYYDLFSRERYTKVDGFYYRIIDENILGISKMTFSKMHTNIGREIQQISKGIIYSSFALEDLVKNNFKTIEQKQLIEAKKQTCYSRKALFVTLVALILSLVSTIFTTCTDTEIDNKQYNQIIQSIEKQSHQKK